jgi:pimeloyl-ACP methyl ester carboxylesterase
MHVEVVGQGPRLVLVHGSVGFGLEAWGPQRRLAERFTLVVPTRSGYPPNPPLERIDFEDQAQEVAELLEPGDHLVGHSYGGVVSLLAAGRRPEALRSLTVLEPPAFGVALDDPAVQDFLGAFEPDYPQDPRGYLEFFLPLVGSSLRLPDPLPHGLEAGARAAIAERFPNEAVIPFEVLRPARFPKLVVSGAHHPAFDAVCDVLERELEAEHAVVPGAGHSIARAPGFNDVLVGFADRA